MNSNTTHSHRSALTCALLTGFATAALLLSGCDKQPAGGTSTVTPASTGNSSAPAPETPDGAKKPAMSSTNTTPPAPAKNASADPSSTTPPPAATPALPGYWFASDVDSWVGKRWSEIDLFHFMEKKPAGLDKGRRYVVFYNRTCDHCEDMFNDDLATDPGLAAMVTAVEVPQEKGLLTSPDGWAMPRTDCEMLSLPLGADWIITTPMTLRIEDGVITCAQESDHKECMGLE